MPKETNDKTAAIDLTQDAGMGLENLNASNMALPFLSILQKLSPQVDEASDKYVQGAKPGMIFNTVTGECFDVEKKPVTFVVCGFKQAWPEWKNRDTQGGGFVKMHASPEIMTQCKMNDKGKPQLPNGHIIVDTAYYFGMIIREDGLTEHAVISMSSSQWKVARNWNAMLSRDLLPNGMVAPAFRCKWALSTSREQKDKNIWWIWKVQKVGAVSEPKVIEISRSFAGQVRDNGLLLANKASTSNEAADNEAF